jgi:hypothetical protein
MADKKNRLAGLECALNEAEAAVAAAEDGVRVATPTESTSLYWVVFKGGNLSTLQHSGIVGKAVMEVLATLKPAIDAMVLERVLAAYENARLKLQEACREVAEL